MYFNDAFLLGSNHDLATAWLLATRQTVGRRRVQSTNVQAICTTIEAPPVPLALRLSSNLLYGAALVYHSQTEFAARHMVQKYPRAARPVVLQLAEPASDHVLLPDPAFSIQLDILPPLPPIVAESSTESSEPMPVFAPAIASAAPSSVEQGRGYGSDWLDDQEHDLSLSVPELDPDFHSDQPFDLDLDPEALAHLADLVGPENGAGVAAEMAEAAETEADASFVNLGADATISAERHAAARRHRMAVSAYDNVISLAPGRSEPVPASKRRRIALPTANADDFTALASCHISAPFAALFGACDPVFDWDDSQAEVELGRPDAAVRSRSSSLAPSELGRRSHSVTPSRRSFLSVGRLPYDPNAFDLDLDLDVDLDLELAATQLATEQTADPDVYSKARQNERQRQLLADIGSSVVTVRERFSVAALGRTEAIAVFYDLLCLGSAGKLTMWQTSDIYVRAT